MFPASDYFDLDATDHRALFADGEPAWGALSALADHLERLLDDLEGPPIRGEVHERAVVGDRVHVAEGAGIEANAVVNGPAWIGAGTAVRSGAYVREGVVVGKDCVLGNSSEFKNCLLFDGVEAPHFNYVGDSILGHRAHLGAGAICSNVRLDRRPVRVRDAEGGSIDTGLGKFGAIVGDGTEVGCNAVLSPGSILGRHCILYPGTHWQGVLVCDRIVKHRQSLQVVERRGG